MITGIAHACYLVPDLERALFFYVNQLGLKVAFEFHRDDGTRYGVYLRIGRRTFIELFRGEVTTKAEKQSYGHICLEVDDVAKTVAELRTKGVACTEPKLGMDEAWQSWIADPDGNRIELHGYTVKSWQSPHF